MGWTSGNMTRSDIISEMTQGYNNDATTRVVTLRKCTSGNTLWLVKATEIFVEDAWVELAESRWIGCVLMQKYGKFEWGYKCLEESMGPSQVSCPLAYLDMVPEPTHNYNWRESVRAYWANRKAQKSWKQGDILDLGHDVNWPSILVKARYVEVIDPKNFFPIIDIRQNGEGMIIKSGYMVALSTWTRQNAKVISAFGLRSAWRNQG